MKHQNQRRYTKAALLTAAIAGVCATGAVAPSFAADQGDLGAAYARGSHSHLRPARHLGSAGHHGGAQLTYFYRGAKLHLVNTDRNGGLDGVASVYHDPITARSTTIRSRPMANT